MLVVAVNYAPLKDPRARIRQKVALDVLDANKPDDCRLIAFTFPDEDVSEIPASFITHRTLHRDASEWIGNNRRLPYIKEILNKAYIYSDSVFGYINSDILLTKSFFDILKDKHDAYFFYRTEIGEVTKNQFVSEDIRPIYGGNHHEGCDAFFFDKEFWEHYGFLFNENLILGETEWDTYYRFMIDSITSDYYVGRDLYHVYHDAKWTEHSKGAQNNIRIWKEFYDSVAHNLTLKEV